VSGTRCLAGNGAGLIKEVALAARVQAGLERVYGLDRVADVSDFVCPAETGEREVLFLRRGEDGSVEVSVQLPHLGESAGLDALCQIIEGVSHFVYVVERSRADRAATQLELELQAEVDKWVVLAGSMSVFDVGRSATLRSRLYEDVTFAHVEASELGERYRVANDVAHRFVRRLEERYLGKGRFGELRAELRRFFHVGQEEKLRLGRVA
jgi:hypothetical protein